MARRVFMNNVFKIVCMVFMYSSCLFGVRQGLLPPNSEFMGLIFLGGFFCIGDAVLAFKSGEKKTGLMYVICAMAIISFGMYFAFLA